MITTCVACGKVLARYLPLDEVRGELCADCLARQLHIEAERLSCGADACIYSALPYECLRLAAQGERPICSGLKQASVS
jgi:hypothetical protein